MAATRMFKVSVWHEDKQLVLATSLNELIEKGLTKLQKTRENFKCLRLSDGTVVDNDECLAFLQESETIHFVFFDKEVPSTSACRPTRASDQRVPLQQHGMAQTRAQTTKTHQQFINCPIGDKSVQKMAGIGPIIGAKLKDMGFGKAYNILGQFLVLDQDKEFFTNWLKESVEANEKQSSQCYQCIKDWCAINL